MAQSKAELAETEVARACAAWQKKFGHLALANSSDSDSSDPDSIQSSREQRAKQFRFLAQRGFSSNAIKIALRGIVDDVDQFDS